MRNPTRTPCLPALALTVLAALALAGSAPARPPGGGKHHGAPGGLVQRHADRLGLDAATLGAVQELVDAAGANDAGLREQLHASRRELHELLSQESPDQQAVFAAAESLGKLETALHKNRLRAILEIRALLNPEQRAELIALREEKMARHRERREHGGRHGTTCGCAHPGAEPGSHAAKECPAGDSHPGSGGDQEHEVPFEEPEE